jgi:hypothetical protein
MRRVSALRRFAAALVGLALALPPALPQAMAAPFAAELPAALAFFCASPGSAAPGQDEGGQASGDHQSCQSCTGACHGMLLASVGFAPVVRDAWVAAIAAACDAHVVARGDLSGYATRAPPLA